MIRNDLVDSIGEIDDDMVETVDALRTAKKGKHPWIKWGALAACLCLVIGLSIPVLHNKGGSDPTSLPTDKVTFVENGYTYEVVDNPELLEKFGLPQNLTADLVGNRVVSYLKPDDGDHRYQESASETDIVLYDYAPFPSRGVYILKDGDKYMAAVFHNLMVFDSNTNSELRELYRVYDIETADDIAVIAELDNTSNKILGSPVTDRNEITKFYNMTVDRMSYGNDDFLNTVFADMPEEKKQDAYNDFSSDKRTLRIEVTSGLRFYISFYPNYGWLHSPGTLSYYKIDEQLQNWIDSNLG